MQNAQIQNTQVQNRRAVYEFSIGLRFSHWLRALMIVILTMSGFFIAYGFLDFNNTEFLANAIWRSIHEIAGFVLIGCVIFKSYLFLTDKRSHGERVSYKDILNPKIWIAQIKYYLFMGEHPHLNGVYNPLQFAAYILFYFMIFVLCLSGLVLYVNNYHSGLGGALYPLMRYIESICGGLSNVRVIHHIFTWGVIIFVCIHIYMAIFNAIKGKDGAIDAIVSGYKFEKDGKRT